MILIAKNALPKDGMCDAKVGSNQHNDVGALEILVGKRRRVEPKRFLVSHHAGGHALSCVAITVNHSHAEFSQSAKQRELLRHDLPRAKPRNGRRTIFALNLFHAHHEGLHRPVPRNPLLHSPGIP